MIPSKVTDFDQAVQFLTTGLPKSNFLRFKNEDSLAESRAFLNLLGNPQEKHRPIHLAGTSGKGSTAMILNQILVAHGKRVGMMVSPHVYTVRERIQINGQPVDENMFTKGFNQLLPLIKQKAALGAPPTYFEVLTGLGWHIFSQLALDYVIVETGLGGRFDTTNCISRRDKLCLLTRVGYDHQTILGNSLAEIAYQKAGIMQPDVTAFSSPQETVVAKVFKKEASDLGVHLLFVSQHSAIKTANRQLIGSGQAENINLAITAGRYLAKHERWQFNTKSAKTGVDSVYLPGRFEELKLGNKIIIFDGAHNQQKMTNLAAQLTLAYPEQTWTAVLAMGEGRASDQAIKPLKTLLKQCILTDYAANYDLGVLATNWRNVPLTVEHTYQSDYKKIATEILHGSQAHWLITGSFYHLASLRQALETAYA